MRLGDDVVGVGDVVGDVDLTAGMDQPHDHAGDVVGESGQIGFGADRRERLPIDLGGVADVVEHPLTLRVALRSRYPSPVAISTSPAGGLPQARSQPTKCRCTPCRVADGARPRRRGRRRRSVRSRGCRCRR